MTPETIYALATPPGVAALAVIRLSGPQVRAVILSLTRRADSDFPAPRRATLAPLYDPASGADLDRVLLTFFPAPHSFTGEDVAELSVHGGLAVVQGLLAALAPLPGLRLAEPGEFTKRAFLNHKLDLTEAEAVADLIHAQTALQRSQALAQLDGSLKNLYEGWRGALIHTAAYIEAHLDFPDEDLPGDLIDKVRPDIARLSQSIAQHLDDGGRGEMIREGVNIVILGPPNAGKSSLLNALARREAAIVSPVAGTTRDLIDVHLDLSGYAVTLTDTAGLRAQDLSDQGQDQVERIGIERAMARARGALLKLVLLDAGTLDAGLDDDLARVIDDDAIIVLNKIDTVSAWPETLQGRPVCPLSVRTGAGLEALIQTIKDFLARRIGAHEGAVLTRARHREILTDAQAALARAQQVAEPELVAEELRGAITALSRLTGRIDVEDLLDVIFRDFCIGK